MKQKNRFPIILVITAFALIGATVFGVVFFHQALSTLKNGQGLQILGQVPDFTLTEASGKKISLKNLAGKIWVADFIFTRCGVQCPLMTQQMSRLSKDLNAKIKNIYFVSFTVDPDFDTPEVLSSYAKGYGADPQGWFFLTGNRETLNHISTGFKMSTLGDPMMHSNHFILVDQAGNIRGYYDATDPEKIKQLKHDIRRVSL